MQRRGEGIRRIQANVERIRKKREGEDTQENTTNYWKITSTIAAIMLITMAMSYILLIEPNAAREFCIVIIFALSLANMKSIEKESGE